MRMKTEHKWHGRRLLAALLTLVMLLSVLPVSVFAAGSEGQIGKHVELESYADGLKDANDASVADVGETVTLESGKVVMMKDIRSTDTKNEFIIDLTVKTSEEIEKQNLSADAAVTLVIDVSSSMQWDMDEEGYCWNEKCKDYKKFFSSDDAKSHKCSAYPSGTPDSKKNGGDQVYAGNPNETTDKWDNSRLEGAINAANSFLSKYVENANGAKRMVSVIAFNAGKETVCGWTDAATTAGYSAVASAIDGLTEKTGTGTSIGGGLNQVSFTGDAASISNKYVILLTDGDPNRKANGDKGTDWNEITTIANNIKRSADLYVISYSDSVTQTSNLQSIASSGCYYSAGNAGSLSIQFGTIVKEIVKRANAWRVTDPMGEHIDFKSFTGGYSLNQNDGSFSESGNTIYWNLKNAKYETEGRIRKYTLSYKIELLTSDRGFVDNKYYPTNEETTLVYALSENGTNVKVDTGYFYVPTVQGESPKPTTPSDAPTATLNLTKKWDSDITPSNDEVSITINGQTQKVKVGEEKTLTFTGLTPGETYTITESPDSYVLDKTSVDLSQLTVEKMTFKTIKEIPSCSKLENPVVDMQGANIIVAARTGGQNAIIWTYRPLDLTEKAKLIDVLKTAGLSGDYKFDEDNKKGPVVFISGKTAQFPETGTAQVSIDAEKGTVTFSDKNVWSKFLLGDYGYIYGGTNNVVTITNSLKKGSLEITKTFSGEFSTAPEGFTANFKVYAGETATGTPISTKHYPADVVNGKITVSNLPYGTYTVVEEVTGGPSVGEKGQAAEYSCTPSYTNGGIVTLDAATAGMTIENKFIDLSAAYVTVEKTGPATATAGDTLTYEITVRNDTRKDATDVVVTDILGDHLGDLALKGTAPAGTTYENGVWTVGNLNANTSKTLTLTAKVDEDLTKADNVEFVKNTVSVTFKDPQDPTGTEKEGTGDEFKTDLVWSELTVEKTIVEVNGVDVTSAAAIPSVQPGQTVKFKITVTNSGLLKAENVTVTDQLPTEMTLVADGTTAGYSPVSGKTNAYSWTVDVDPATVDDVTGDKTNGTTDVYVVARVNEDALPEGTYHKRVFNTALLDAENYSQTPVDIDNGKGGLTITKSLDGSDLATAEALAAKGVEITFTVTNTKNAADTHTITLAEALVGESLDLEPGDYVVTENAGTTPDGYTLTTTVRVSNDENAVLDSSNSYTATVEAGKKTTVAFTNVYTSRNYRVVFDAAEMGVIKDNTDLKDEKSISYRYWFAPVEARNNWKWNANGKGSAATSQISFKFSQSDYDRCSAYMDPQNGDGSIPAKVTAVGKAGVTWTGEFALVDNNGNFVRKADESLVTYSSLADAVALLHAAGSESYVKEIKNQYPVASDGIKLTTPVSVYEIRFVALYTLTYTFNDYGSPEGIVEMAGYNKEDDTVTYLGAFTDFGTESAPECFTDATQAGLDSTADYKPTYFFVKLTEKGVNEGYQIIGIKNRNGSMSATEVNGTIMTIADAEAENYVPQAVLDAAKAAGYKDDDYCFRYTDSNVNYLNRYFKVIASQDAVAMLGGTKTVKLGGNQAPSDAELTFKLYEKTDVKDAATGEYEYKEIDSKTIKVSEAGDFPFSFKDLVYTKADEHEYKIVEVKGSSTRWTYDETVYTVKVTVTGSKETSDLSAAVEYSIGDKTVTGVTFENTYTYNKYVPKEEENGDGDKEIKIPDDPTPLAPLPELPEEPAEPTEEIPDEEIPLAPVPKTGDASALWLALTALSGTGLAGVAVLGRKKRDEEE